MLDYIVEIHSSDMYAGVNPDSLTEEEKWQESLIASNPFTAENDEDARIIAKQFIDETIIPRSITGNPNASMPYNAELYRVDNKTNGSLRFRVDILIS